MPERLIVDVHTHNGQWPFPGRYADGDIRLNLELMQQCGIALSIISSTRAIVSDMEAGNAKLAEILAHHSNLRGYVVVNPRRLADSVREMERYAAHPGFIGVKIHPTYSQTPINSPRMVPLMAEVAARGKPLLIHTWGEGEVKALADFAAQYPTLPIIVGHGGGDAWRAAITAAQHLSNLYLEYCFSQPIRGRISAAVAALDGRQVLFGSDMTLFDPAYCLAAYDAAPMTDTQRQRVMAQNAIELFHFQLPTITL